MPLVSRGGQCGRPGGYDRLICSLGLLDSPVEEYPALYRQRLEQDDFGTEQ